MLCVMDVEIRKIKIMNKYNVMSLRKIRKN